MVKSRDVLDRKIYAHFPLLYFVLKNVYYTVRRENIPKDTKRSFNRCPIHRRSLGAVEKLRSPAEH